MVEGEKLAVTPLGTPLIDMFTAELNPLAPVVARMMRMLAPGTTLALVAAADKVKLGVNTVREKLWDLVIPPPVPVTVMV